MANEVAKAGAPRRVMGNVAAGVAAPRATPPPAPRALTSRQKAAVIVRLLLAEGAPLPLSALPEHLQAALTEEIGQMRLVDRETLRATVEEFLAELEGVGLSFPGGLDGALGLLDGHISATAAARLRRMTGLSDRSDPWDQIAATPPDRLMPLLEAESAEVAAVLLSKLPVARAAELMGRLPGDRARRIAYAVSQTAAIDPDTVRRIGQALASGLAAAPENAFAADPVDRVGAILNVSAAVTRDEVLRGLTETDAAFAEQVRRAIFTFPHIPHRLPARDVPKVLRVVDQPTVITALAGAAGPEETATVEFLLANMSQRLAAALREEIEARGPVKPKDAETAQTAVVAAIRTLEAAGEVQLVSPEEES